MNHKVTCAIHDGIHDMQPDCSACMPAGSSKPTSANLTPLDHEAHEPWCSSHDHQGCTCAIAERVEIAPLARIVAELQQENERLKQENAAEIAEFNAGFQVGIAGLDLETAEREYYDVLPDDAPRFDVFGVGYAWAVFEKLKVQLAAARAEVERLSKQVKQLRYVPTACPCLHVAPCHTECSCVNPKSRRGCERCCSHGGINSQRAQAERLAGVRDDANLWINETDKLIVDNARLRAALAQISGTIAGIEAEAMNVIAIRESPYHNGEIGVCREVAAIVAASTTTLTPEMIAWLDEHRDDAIADGAEAFGEKFGIKGTAAGELIVQWLALRKGTAERQEGDDGKG